MAELDTAERALAIVRETRMLVERLIPREALLTEFVRPLVFFVLVRCLSRFTAIEVLLGERLTDEATIVLRSLANDSMRLDYLDQHPATRAAHATWWWNEQLGQRERLSRVADRTGHPGGADIRERIAEERRALDETRRRLGIRRDLAMPSEGRALAVAIKAPEDELDYLLSTNPSHTTVGSAFGFSTGQGVGEFGVHVRDPDPEDVAAVGDRACVQFLRGAAAAFKIIGWDGPEAIEAQGEHNRATFGDLLGHIWQ